MARGEAEVERPHDHANVLYVFRASRGIKRNSEARGWEIMERDLERKVTRSSEGREGSKVT